MGEKNLGNYIRGIRLKKGGKGYWSLSAVAKRAGISHSFLSQVERGHYMASPQFLTKLAPALQVPVEELYRQAGLLPRDARQAGKKLEHLLADKEFMRFYRRYTKLSPKGKELLHEYEAYLRKKFSS